MCCTPHPSNGLLHGVVVPFNFWQTGSTALVCVCLCAILEFVSSGGCCQDPSFVEKNLEDSVRIMRVGLTADRRIQESEYNVHYAKHHQDPGSNDSAEADFVTFLRPCDSKVGVRNVRDTLKL